MTLKAYLAQERVLRSMRGQTCARAATGAGSWSLLLDFGELAPANARGYREPRYGLVVECPWRLEDRTRVLAGSGDASETVDGAVQVCVGKRIERLTVYRPSFMLHVHFSAELSLWAFPEDTRSYAPTSDDPSSPWYVAGRVVSGGWED